MRSPLLLLLAWLGSVGWATQTFAASNYSQNFDSNTAPGWSSSSFAGVQSFTATGGYYTNDNYILHGQSPLTTAIPGPRTIPIP